MSGDLRPGGDEPRHRARGRRHGLGPGGRAHRAGADGPRRPGRLPRDGHDRRDHARHEGELLRGGPRRRERHRRGGDRDGRRGATGADTGRPPEERHRRGDGRGRRRAGDPTDTRPAGACRARTGRRGGGRLRAGRAPVTARRGWGDRRGGDPGAVRVRHRPRCAGRDDDARNRRVPRGPRPVSVVGGDARDGVRQRGDQQLRPVVRGRHPVRRPADR